MNFLSPKSNKPKKQLIFPTNSPKENLQSSLPSDFAFEIIDKEIQLEKSWDHSTIHELIGLYSKAIEYYELQHDPRFYDYQQKIHKLLVKPQVLQTLQRETESKQQGKYALAHTTDCEEMTSKRAATDFNRKKLANRLNRRLAPTVKRDNRTLKKILNRQIKLTQSTSTKALSDLKSQNNDLEVRLASRKSKHNILNLSYRKYSNDLNTSLKTDSPANLSTTESIDRYIRTEPDEQDNEDTDYSGFFNSPSCSNDLERRLEEIMEKYLAEKVNKISDITVNYKLQMKELEDQGGIMKQVLEQMKINMQEEINKVTQELDAKKSKEIEALKREFFIEV
ncbi:unnamed protein product [Blepharisma stoltei]|uniref:Uncharacterized protein n=1 Tax=Blepharisma stoltei TaxID=1481888 RepID=A0AAU9JCC1_9CILI|nr:unnamed protein product [Blepharisma stoltei]